MEYDGIKYLKMAIRITNIISLLEFKSLWSF
jgi:hypothetical protein